MSCLLHAVLQETLLNDSMKTKFCLSFYSRIMYSLELSPLIVSCLDLCSYRELGLGARFNKRLIRISGTVCIVWCTIDQLRTGPWSRTPHPPGRSSSSNMGQKILIEATTSWTWQQVCAFINYLWLFLLHVSDVTDSKNWVHFFFCRKKRGFLMPKARNFFQCLPHFRGLDKVTSKKLN
jgi:hypothetical protein